MERGPEIAARGAACLLSGFPIDQKADSRGTWWDSDKKIQGANYAGLFSPSTIQELEPKRREDTRSPSPSATIRQLLQMAPSNPWPPPPLPRQQQQQQQLFVQTAPQFQQRRQGLPGKSTQQRQQQELPTQRLQEQQLQLQHDNVHDSWCRGELPREKQEQPKAFRSAPPHGQVANLSQADSDCHTFKLNNLLGDDALRAALQRFSVPRSGEPQLELIDGGVEEKAEPPRLLSSGPMGESWGKNTTAAHTSGFLPAPRATTNSKKPQKQQLVKVAHGQKGSSYNALCVDRYQSRVISSTAAPRGIREAQQQQMQMQNNYALQHMSQPPPGASPPIHYSSQSLGTAGISEVASGQTDISALAPPPTPPGLQLDLLQPDDTLGDVYDDLLMSSALLGTKTGATAPARTALWGNKTTLMVRNIPVSYTKEMLLHEWPNTGTYDYLFVPVNYNLRRSFIFAFINFISPAEAKIFCKQWHKQRLAMYMARKPLDISLADLQGRDENLRQYKRQRVNRVGGEQSKPAVFVGGRVVDLGAALAALDSSGQPQEGSPVSLVR